MSESVAVCCPSCRAAGELSDDRLVGKPIRCSVCQAIFIVPNGPVIAAAPPPAAAPVSAAPLSAAVAVTSPLQAEPVIPAGLPSAAAPLASPIAVPVGQPIAQPVVPQVIQPVDQPVAAESLSFGVDATADSAPSSSRPAHSRRKAQASSGVSLIKVTLLSVFSALMMFMIVVLSQKAPKRRQLVLDDAAATSPKKSRKPKRRSRPAPELVAAAETTKDLPAPEMDGTDAEMPLESLLKPAEPEAPKMVAGAAGAKPKPAAPTPATPIPETPAPTVGELLKLALEHKGADRVAAVDPILRMKADGFSGIVGILDHAETATEMQKLAGELLGADWDSGSYSTKHAETLKKLLNDVEQPVTVRTGCAVALKEMEEDDPLVAPTLVAAVTDPNLDPALRSAAVFGMPRDHAEFLSTLMTAAEICEAPLAENTSDYDRLQGDRFYTCVLASMKGLRPEDRVTVLPLLLTAVNNPSSMVKQYGLETIEYFGQGTPEIVEAIRRELKNPQARVREKAARAAGRLHDIAVTAVPELREALKAEERQVRDNAARALSEFGPAAAEAVPDLIALLALDDKLGASHVARTLVLIAPQDEAAVAAVMQALDQPHTRDDAISALEDLGPGASVALPKLRTLLTEVEPSQRVGILRVFSRLGEVAAPALPEILLQCEHADIDVRAAAAMSIRYLKRHAEPAVPTLVKLLGDADENVQLESLLALQKLGWRAKSAIPDVEKLAEATTSNRVKERIQEALPKLKADPGDGDPILFEALLDDSTGEEFVESLEAQLDVSLPALVKFARHEDLVLRGRAWLLISEFIEKAAGLTVLEKMLVGMDLQERLFASIVLRQVPLEGDRAEFAQALRPWLQVGQADQKPEWLLVRLGSPAVPTIAAILTDERLPHEIRGRMVEAILQHDDFVWPPLLPPLQEAMKSDDPLKRRVAALALARIQPRESSALPLVLECVLGDVDEVPREGQLAPQPLQTAMGGQLTETTLQREGLLALKGMSEAGTDVSAALPAMLKLLADIARDPTRQHGIPLEYWVDDISALTSQIRVRPADLPALREMLTNTLVIAVNDEKSGQQATGPRFPRYGRYTAGIVLTVGNLGPAGVEVLPDIKALLQLGGGAEDEIVVDRLARGLAGLGEPAIAMLSEVARQGDGRPVARRLAVQLLDAITDGDERANELFAELLKDADESVRTSAALAVAKRPKIAASALPALRAALSNLPPGNAGGPPGLNTLTVSQENDVTVMYPVLEAIESLRMKSVDAVPELLVLTTNPKASEYLRVHAANVLIKIAPDSADVRSRYLELIKTLPEAPLTILIAEENNSLTAEIVAELTRVVEDPASPRREMAARLLGQLAEKAAAAVPALRTLEMADQGAVGLTAAVAVAQIDASAKDLVPRIMEAFVKGAEQNPGLFYQIYALLHLGPNAVEALPQLIEIIKDPNSTTDHLALQVIGGMGTAAQPALPAMKEVLARLQTNHIVIDIPRTRDLDDAFIADFIDRQQLSYHVLQTLQALGPVGAELGPDLIALLRAGNESPMLIDALAKMGAPGVEAVKLLQADLADETRRLVAINRLAMFGPVAAPAVAELIKLAGAEDPQLRMAALRALSVIGPQATDAALVLVAALADADLRVAGFGATGLLALKEQALPVLPQIIAALGTSRGKSLETLVELLHNLGPAAKDAIPALTTLRASNNLEMRNRARLALEKVQVMPAGEDEKTP